MRCFPGGDLAADDGRGGDDPTAHTTATLVIHPDNVRSLALAARLSFTAGPDLDGNRYFTRELQNR